MELFINGNKVDITLENEQTVGDVLKSFEEECARNEATTVSIVLNGHLVSANEFEETAKTPLDDNTKLELAVISKSDIITSFKSSAEKAGKIAAQLSQIAVKFQGGKDAEANAIIASLADLIDEICNASTLSALFPDIYVKIKINEKPINQFFQEFQPVLSDFEKAIESKDTVMIGDLAEYEISPRLTELAKALEF